MKRLQIRVAAPLVSCASMFKVGILTDRRQHRQVLQDVLLPWHLGVLGVRSRLCHPDPGSQQEAQHSHNTYNTAVTCAQRYRHADWSLGAWSSSASRLSWLALQEATTARLDPTNHPPPS